MEDNKKIDAALPSPDDETPSDDTSEDSQNPKNTEDTLREEPPREKSKKFFERHPRAKNILQGAGVVVAVLGLSALIQRLCDESSMPSLDYNEKPDDAAPDSLSNEEADVVPPQEEIPCVRETTAREPITFPRKGGIVNLPITQHASPQKREEAERNGIELGEHQTTRRDHECTR